MTERFLLALTNAFVLLIILMIHIITPKTTRRNILFGVKVPERVMEHGEIIDLRKSFTRYNLLIGIPALLLLSFLVYRFPHSLFVTMATFIYLGLLFLIYLRFNYKVKELKKEKGWGKDAEKIVLIDIKYSRDKSKIGNIPPLWFLLPLILIIFNFILGIVLYPTLPDQIPTHWNFRGEITSYRDKSYGTVLMLPAMQLFMLGLFYFSNWSIGRTKQEIDPKNPEESLRKNIIFRRAWSIYLYVITILTILLFTFLNLLIYGIFETNRPINIFAGILVVFSIIGGTILSLKVGQGGERLRLKDHEATKRDIGREDDHLWKLGNTIYYNPEDSSIFVEKRYGVGWTVNAGRPLGILILMLPFIVLIITLIITERL